MEGEDKSSSCLVRPCPEIENRSGDGIGCEPIAKMDNSQLVGGDDPSSLTVDSAAGGGEAAAHAAVVVDVKTEVNVDDEGGAKKKRGRPPRGQTRPPPIKKMKEEEEEEDVCFICFDGGSLVLCDRRGCPKAYHPACIKRDEAFFRSKAKWNCGWHICSICQKAAHYMCYTCTYSLCKACTKKADYLAVRENKGFCITCMRTIMLIENNDQGNKEMPQVDFDDKSSWEYLFKVYWIYLKEKLSLTVEELIQAKNPWKAVSAVACNKSLKMRYGGDNNQVFSSSFNISVGHQESNDSKRRTTEQPKLPNNGDSPPTSKSSCNQGNTSSESTEWASEDLLEFVSHMKNGDTSVLSQFDVQTLLLDYIKRNNLRDPSRKSQIICDFRLKNLFGRPRVGHFEMLKLLEFHFRIKEDFKKDVVQGNIIDGVLSQVEVGGNNENLLMTGKERKHKTRTKVEERGPQVNLDEYAAIDVHNINLIYLRRNLMESLVVDSGKFHEKVVGSIVRIRISNNDQKQDMYRLVQVVGTSKAALPYKIGEKTADFVLEILNLDKKETISIDVISNQAFSEDECRRLRQSIKCGLVKRLTVGQVKEKAVALQEVRLNDWLETEVLRLNHLRDRASEKGHKKGLRECIEKLELLKTPEERQRRLREIPEVHADPNMDPNCDSDQDAREIDNKKQGDNLKPRYSGFGRKRRESISAETGDSKNNSATGLWKKLNTCGQNRSLPTKFYLENGAPSRVVQRAHDSHYKGKDSCASNGSEKPGNRIDSCGSVGGGRNNQAVLRSESFRVRAPETSILSLSAASAPSANDSETDKLWHYRDPNGKIQGPFCVVQLRKWSTTGYFPPEMRIWCTNNEEVDSILLTDLLSGKLCKVFPLQSNDSVRSKGVIAPRDGRLYCFDDRSCGSVNTTDMEGSKVLAPYACNNESVISDGWGSQSSNWMAPVNKTDGHTGSSSQSLDSLKFNNVYSDHLQANCPLEQQDGTSLHQGKGQEEKMCSSASNLGNGTSHESTTFQTSGEASHENQSDGQGYPGQSSGVNWRPLPINLSSKNGDSHSGFSSVAGSSDSSEPQLEIDIPNLPSPTPKTSNGDLEGQAIKAETSAPLSLPVQDSGLHNLPSPTPELSGDEKADSNMQNLPSPPLNLGDGDKKTEAAENKQPASSKCPVQESGSSWSSASSLVVGGERQCRETADEWSGCSPARAKPSVEEGDSGLGSVTSLKPPELANDHAATPTSKCDQLTPPSPPHPVFNESTWRLEPIEFSTLDEESVSDLLAEVDAMESQCGLASPTSIMYSDDELFQDPNDNCFNSIGVLSHPLDSGKGDALSSTGDITIPRQFTMTGEPLCAAQAQAQAIDHVKRSCVKSSTTFEVYVEKQPTYFSANKTEAGPNREPDTSQRAEQKPMNTIWGTAQGNMNLGLGGINNVGWGAGLETTLGNENMNWSTSAGFMGSESFPLYGGEKFVGPSDWESSWRRQSINGDGGVGGESYFRTPPKGQRVCKFYENGNCPRGSFCNHFDP